MNTNLKITLRNLYRDKMYATVNILGLAMAICCVLIIGLYLRNELTYDQHHVNHKKIFRVVNEFKPNGASDRFAPTSRALGPMLKENYPVIEGYVQIQPSPGTSNKKLLRHGDQAYYWDKYFVASDNIFKVFTHKILYGDPKTALVNPDSIAVSETFARQYFKDANPIGKIIQTENGSSKSITLVFADLLDNAHLKYDVLTSLNQRFYKLPEDLAERRQRLWNAEVFTYLVLPESYQAADFAAISEDFYQKNMAEQAKKFNASWHAWLQPLADVHFSSELGYDQPTGNRFYIYGFAAVGIFILFIACINYINLSTARATRNAKSIGMRKIIGADRGTLMMQSFGESILFALIAAILGIVLTELVLTISPFNSLIGKQLNLDLLSEPLLLPGILGASLLIGIISGLYPALYLSSWAPLSAMVSKHNSKGNVRFRQLLVLLQFTISIAVIASTLLMSSQMHFIAEKSLGFARENRIMITLRGEDVIQKAPALMKEFSNDKGILGITTGDTVMGQKNIPMYLIEAENNQGVKQPTSANRMLIDENFLQVMGMRLIAGRGFSEQMPRNSLIVNESFVKKQGWEQPVGKHLYLGPEASTVIGVVADFNFKSLHNVVEPIFMQHYRDDDSPQTPESQRLMQRMMIVNVAGDNIRQTLKHIEDKFATVDPAHPFEFRFMDDSLNDLYGAEQRMMKLVGIFAGICMLIACMGLFGLAVFTTEQRTKEIGIRKVLGASTMQIIALLSRNILLLVIIGAGFASVISYYAISEWLASFAYRMTINPMVFLTSTVAALAVAYITIAAQSYKTATANPIKALRYE